MKHSAARAAPPVAIATYLVKAAVGCNTASRTPIRKGELSVFFLGDWKHLDDVIC